MIVDYFTISLDFTNFDENIVISYGATVSHWWRAGLQCSCDGNFWEIKPPPPHTHTHTHTHTHVHTPPSPPSPPPLKRLLFCCWQEIPVEFEAFSPMEKDFDGIRMLLQQVFILVINTSESDPHSFEATWAVSKKDQEKSRGFNGTQTYDLCDTGAMLCQMSCEALLLWQVFV